MDSAAFDWYTRTCEKLDAIERACFLWGREEGIDRPGRRHLLHAAKGYPDVPTMFDQFLDVWHEKMPPYKWSRETMRRIEFSDQSDYLDFITINLMPLREAARLKLITARVEQHDPNIALFNLLHPIIANRAWDFYVTNHFRQAVETSVTAVFDYIRARTQSQLDGQALVTEVFKLEGAKLILSTLDTESGRSEQKGFINIFVGAYVGIRNPLAHTVINGLTQKEAAEHMVLASLLASKVDKAILVED
ncbi:TIGR02391 family protein [Paraburkholderia sp. DHOC27]|uniref:TIGR02391 family protein n=1 Tax=Paraburkholderia sp. DHOC27 TaxID=2303330 RepID=UPI000E3E1FA6|nr:TIGR02391 family protein [Paraburkholderia sp. DHOC27]RFU45024.1 TIGR02391 family protein [Paraburkholderia sp. DHOC27]